jgi:hypothetical protein
VSCLATFKYSEDGKSAEVRVKSKSEYRLKTFMKL